MIRAEFRFKYKVNDVFTLYPLADLHSGASEFLKKRLIRDLADVDDHSIIIGNGDWFDAIVLSDPRYGKPSDATKSPAMINEAVEELATILRPVSRRIFGIGIGNHEEKYITKSGCDPTIMLIDKLSTCEHGIKHLGLSAFIRLVFEHESGGRIRTLTIYQHHGFGAGGRTAGHSITKYTRHAQDFDADIFCYGHDHTIKDLREMGTQLGIDGKLGWRERKRFLALCGCYKKTLNNSEYPTYEERCGFGVSPLGCLRINLTMSSSGIIIGDMSGSVASEIY
jgi:hypothetical protein